MSEHQEFSRQDYYPNFAPYYDQIFDAVATDRNKIFNVTRQLIENMIPKPLTMLDLGTGTGGLLKEFRDDIEILVGLDSSSDMLEVAKTKLPEAEFIEGDMSDFNLDRKFDVIVCMFDAINHLKDIDRWEGLFASASRHLNRGGQFIFDTHTIASLSRLVTYKDGLSWPVGDGLYNYKARRSGLLLNEIIADFSLRPDTHDQVTNEITGQIREITFPLQEIRTRAAIHLHPLTSLDLNLASSLNKNGADFASDTSLRAMFVYTNKKETST